MRSTTGAASRSASEARAERERDQPTLTGERQLAAIDRAPARRTRRVLAAGLATLGLLAAVIPPAAAASSATTTAPPAPRRIISAWLPYWSTQTSLARVEAAADVYTDASPFWYDLRRDGSLNRKSSGTSDAVIADTVRRLHAAGLAVYPTVGQEQNTVQMAAFLGSATKRALHVAALVREVRERNFDGIDLDYESMNFGGSVNDRTIVRNRFVVMVQELSTALHAEGKKLSITVGPRVSDLPTSNWAVYDYAALGAAADRFRIMTYDYGWRGGKANPVSPYWWVETVLKYSLARVPASKTWVGIPTYGYDWPANARATAVTHARALELQKTYGAERVWNEQVSLTDTRVVRAPSFTYRKNGVDHQVWYNDAASITALTGLVGQYQLGGAALWSVGSEDPATWAAVRAYARSIAPVVPVTTLSKSATTVRYGQEATLTAQVRDRAGMVLPGVKVTLQSRVVGAGGRWNALATARADKTGLAGFPVKPKPAREYRVVSGRSWTRATAVSAAKGFRLVREVTALAKVTTVRGKQVVRLTGHATPGRKGLTVLQQRLVRGKWVTVRTGRTDVRGAYVLTAPAKSGTYRAVLRPTKYHTGNVSTRVTLRVPVKSAGWDWR